MGVGHRITKPAEDEITQILADLSDTDHDAAAELLPLVYKELRVLSAEYLRSERPDHTLQATTLVHEAYPNSAVLQMLLLIARAQLVANGQICICTQARIAAVSFHQSGQWNPQWN